MELMGRHIQIGEVVVFGLELAQASLVVRKLVTQSVVVLSERYGVGPLLMRHATFTVSCLTQLSSDHLWDLAERRDLRDYPGANGLIWYAGHHGRIARFSDDHATLGGHRADALARQSCRGAPRYGAQHAAHG